MRGAGWVKLHREALQNGWLQNQRLWAFWCYCILKASHRPTTVMVGYQRVNLEPGQFIFGREKAAAELKMTVKQVRTCLDTLKRASNVAVKTASKYSVITVVNWSTYQGREIEGGQQNGQQEGRERASKGPARGHKQEYKERKEVKKTKKILPSPVGEEHAGEVWVSKRKRKLEGKRLETFKRFWSAFDYKAGRAEAIDAWLDIPKLTASMVETIVAAAEREAKARAELRKQGRTPIMAQGWLTARRWEDEHPAGMVSPASSVDWDALLKEAREHDEREAGFAPG